MAMTNSTLVRSHRDPFDHSRLIWTAWEPSSAFGPHGTISFFEDKCYGQIGTLSPKIDLPVGQERFDAVAAHYEAEHARAHEAILAAHPDLVEIEHDGIRLHGEVCS